MFTSHGHQIYGTTAEPRPVGMLVMHCGGPNLCDVCAAETLREHAKTGGPHYMSDNENESYLEKALRLTYNYVKAHLEKTDSHVTFVPDDVYIVWSCKTLQNWKALVSTTLPDGMYYELTHNGDAKVTYIDAYKKFDNVAVADGN